MSWLFAPGSQSTGASVLSPSNECSGLISFGIDWLYLLLFAVQGAIVHNAAMNTGIQISLQGNDSFPLDTYPEVELLYHMVVLFLTF